MTSLGPRLFRPTQHFQTGIKCPFEMFVGLKEMEWEEGCIEEWSHRLREAQNMPSPILATMH